MSRPYLLLLLLLLLPLLVRCAGEPVPAPPRPAPARRPYEIPPSEVRIEVPRLCLVLGGLEVAPDSSRLVARRVRVPPLDWSALGVAPAVGAPALLSRVRRHFARTALSVALGFAGGRPCRVIVVGGSAALLGRTEGRAGLAPPRSNPRAPVELAFVFPEAVVAARGRADVDRLAGVIAHEAGHLFGLRHVWDPGAVMFAQSHGGGRRFKPAETLEGRWQDAPRLLQALLGGDSERCGADALEPNDDRASGRSIGLGALRAESCAEDEDWYTVTLPPRVAVEISVVHEPGVVFDALRLFRPRGRRPAGAVYSAGAETGVRLYTTRGGRHRLRVRAREAGPTPYLLQIWMEEQG